VLVGSLPTAASSTPTAPSSTPPLSAITDVLPEVSGSWGSGHLFAGTVFSAVVTDDGRVAIGAVVPELLYAALAG